MSLPVELISKTDKAAAETYASRSEFIRQAIVEKLQRSERVANIQSNELLDNDYLSASMTDAKLKQVIAALTQEQLQRTTTRMNARPRIQSHQRPSAKY
jgi:metal-responsive CopG/Arc/MetJ family transcriptional regulator